MHLTSHHAHPHCRSTSTMHHDHLGHRYRNLEIAPSLAHTHTSCIVIVSFQLQTSCIVIVPFQMQFC